MSDSSLSNPSAASRCPLCGGPNECALAADAASPACWCFTADISPQALAAVPPEDRGRACVCPRCAAGPGEDHEGRGQA